MWICLNDAFLSIVSKDCARDEILVRARRSGDIEKIFPDADVIRTAGVTSDYLFRATIKRAVVAEALVGEVARITYSNFKNSVADKELHDAYTRVWTTMEALQPNSITRRWRERTLFDDDKQQVAASPRGDAAPRNRKPRRKPAKRRSLKAGS